MSETTADQRGILYPSRLPTFHREPVSEALADRVRWIWIPRWDLPAGQRDRQEVLPFPACNLVVEPDGVSLYGPTTSISYRELEGRGWAVGALLRPAGAGALCSPSLIRDSHRPLEDPDLKVAVAVAMADSNTTTGGQRAASALAAWVAQYTGPPQAMALTANRMEDVVASDRSILRVDQLARRLDLSIRSLQRLSERYITRRDQTLPAPGSGTTAAGGSFRHRCAGGRRARLRGPRPPDCRLPTSPGSLTEPVPTADHQRSSGSQ